MHDQFECASNKFTRIWFLVSPQGQRTDFFLSLIHSLTASSDLTHWLSPSSTFHSRQTGFSLSLALSLSLFFSLSLALQFHFIVLSRCNFCLSLRPTCTLPSDQARERHKRQAASGMRLTARATMSTAVAFTSTWPGYLYTCFPLFTVLIDSRAFDCESKFKTKININTKRNKVLRSVMVLCERLQ